MRLVDSLLVISPLMLLSAAGAFAPRRPAFAWTTASSTKAIPSPPATSSSSLFYKDDANNVDEDLDSNNDSNEEELMDSVAMNVLGTALRPCCGADGEYCSTRHTDHDETVCCQVTQQFLDYSKANGNDLMVDFDDGTPGLRPGDIGCITVDEWAEAYNQGMAPYLWLEATHSKALQYVPLDFLQVFAIDLEQANQRLDQLNTDRARLDRPM